jgi:hypothetical protein
MENILLGLVFGYSVILDNMPNVAKKIKKKPRANGAFSLSIKTKFYLILTI